MKFQVAIIGSPGSGKTVLTAVLAKYLSGHSDKVYMNPRGAYKYVGNDIETISTSSYIHDMLDLLNRGQWATTGTAANTKYELGFELHIDGNAYEMKLLDSAGEDLQKIGTTYDTTGLSPFQRKLFDYIVSSNAVVIIVNLDHFADAPTLKAKAENENVLNEAVTNIVKTGTCHYILVCFTAYDKYKAIIDQTYNGKFVQYLKGELPTFYRSCQMASEKEVRDYTEHGFGSKNILVDCIAVAPVIAQRPAAGINPDKVGKPPVGFDIRNNRHSWGISQIADWLYKCEQSERGWSDVEETIVGGKKWQETLSYRIIPIVLGTFGGLLVWFLLADLMLGSATTSATLLFTSLFFGSPIGAGIGFLCGDALKASITGKDGFFFPKRIRRDEGEEQEESATPPPRYTGGTSTAPPRPTSTSGASTAPPRPSGTGGTAATSGSEELD